jgi:integrase
MTKVNSTAPARSRKARKPKKPHKDYPLFPHSNGQWAKKVVGKIHFFGKWDDPQKALDTWLKDKDAILAGMPRPSRHPHDTRADKTLRELVNRFLSFKKSLIGSGELSERTWIEYYATGERILDVFGHDRAILTLTTEDFERLRVNIANQWGATRLGNEVQRVRSVFKYAYETDLIDRPVKFGPGFKKPTLKTLRKERAAKGPRMFEAKDIRAMHAAADGQLRAMILLGVNVGFGNEDVATLRIDGLDLESGWVRHPRPKTGIERKAKLWPETIQALQHVLDNRKEPAQEHARLVFITKYGKPWANGSYGTALTHEMDKLLRALKLKRPGMSFYTLRHVFATIGADACDQVAVNQVMGHADASVVGMYRERIADERLVAVAEHVRRWLFAEEKPRLKIAKEDVA